MQLSRRMEALAAMVPKGAVLADVGTDHGYLPIALCERNRIPSAIAMDLRKGPLARAKQHIVETGLSESIETRLSDGLTALMPGEAQTILIAGMGGPLTVRILAAHPEVAQAADCLILQPQSEVGEVRRFCAQAGLLIVQEDMVCEDGKFYPMMRLAHGKPYALTEPEAAFGPCLLRERHPVLKEYLVWEQAQCEKILRSLSQIENTRTRERRALIEARLQLICVTGLLV